MNLKYNLLVFTILLLFSFTTNAKYPNQCDSLLPITKESLYGSWQETYAQFISYLTFKRDGSYEGKINSITDGKTIWKFGGIWSLNGSIIDYKYTYSSLDSIQAGETDSDEIIEIYCTKIKFKNSSGRIGSLHR